MIRLFSYRKKGVGNELIKSAIDFSKTNRYDFIELTLTECQEYIRKPFFALG